MQQAWAGAAVIAVASGRNVPTSAANNKSVAVRRCMDLGKSEPQTGLSIEENLAGRKAPVGWMVQKSHPNVA